MNRYIDTSLVIVEERHRKEFDEDAHQELIASIERVGLLQAPVLELVGDKHVLRAGERRFRAVSEIWELGGSFSYDGKPVPAGMLPHTLWTDLTQLQRLEIEVEENNQREAFTWQERAQATAKLRELREVEAIAEGKPLPSVADLAVEVRGSKIGSNHTATRNDLILAGQLHRPEVAAAKNAGEAMLLLKKAEQAEYHQRLAKAMGDEHQSLGARCIHADSAEWMKLCGEAQFDVICTDPPYGIGADTFGSSQGGTTTSHGYGDSEEDLRQILNWFPEQSYRVARAQAHAYIFLDIEHFPTWKGVMQVAGWKVFRTPLIWVRPTGFRTPWITQGPQRKYEAILYAVKGERPVNLIAPDVITLQSPGEGLGHPAAKPAGIYAELLRRSVRPGDSVLDPFCGSGPVFEAARSLKCSATGVEIGEVSYGIALAQINKGREERRLL